MGNDVDLSLKQNDKKPTIWINIKKKHDHAIKDDHNSFCSIKQNTQQNTTQNLASNVTRKHVFKTKRK